MGVADSGPLLACLLGPTASGKTAAALALAARAAAHGHVVEIISMDSALVYQGMDVGTAKPSHAERHAVRHHLIDIIDPAQSYSAAAFHADTRRLVTEILARGATPLLVGGTMMYFRALTQGLAPLPQADAAVRAGIDAQAAREGWPAVHARLAEHDPESAARLAPHDSQRIQRALEVWLLTGVPLSTLQSAHTPGESGLRCRAVSLEPSERSILHERIERRFDAMLEGGLIDEVVALRQRGDLHVGLPSVRCVGYRQVWAYLDGEDDATIMRDKGIFATRQLCKRQLTWLRSIPERMVVDCCAADATERAVAAVERLWQAEPAP